jgi:hypothetical protein
MNLTDGSTLALAEYYQQQLEYLQTVYEKLVKPLLDSYEV